MINDQTSNTLNPKNIKRGIKLFAFLTILGFGIIFFKTTTLESWHTIKQISLSYMLIVLFLALFNHLCSCLQLHILVHRLAPAFKFIHSCEATLGNLFMAAITPTQSGGGPIQLVLLKARGLTFPQALAAGFMQFVASVAFLFLSVIFLMVFPNSIQLLPKIRYLLNYGLVVMIILGITFFLAIIKPAVIIRVVKMMMRLIARFMPRRFRKSVLQATHKLIIGIEESHISILYFFRKGKLTVIGAILFASGSMISKFIIAYVIIYAFGYQADFVQVISIQIILNFLVYFAPSPGASGVAELASAMLMVMVVPEHFLGIFTVLWRIFTTFIGVAIGGVLILRFVSRVDSDMFQKTAGKRTTAADNSVLAVSPTTTYFSKGKR